MKWIGRNQLSKFDVEYANKRDITALSVLQNLMWNMQTRGTIDGDAIIGHTHMDWRRICHDLLGVTLGDRDIDGQ